MANLTAVDKIALYLGGGLVITGVVVIGILEIALGVPHPVTTDGQIVHETLVPLAIRSYIILLGLLLWGGYGIFRVITTTSLAGQDVDTPAEATK